MDAARREKREHGTMAFPFQIYPALDGSEAHDSDYIPYHWHPEMEIIVVDAGEVGVTIADREYSGQHGDIFFVAAEQMHEIRAAGSHNRFHSFVFAPDFLQFTGNDLAQQELLAPLASRQLAFETCLRAGQAGQKQLRTLLAQCMRAALLGKNGYQLSVKAALLGIVAVGAEHNLLHPTEMRQGADYKMRQLKEIVTYLSDHFTEALPLQEVAGRFGLSPQYFCAFFKENFGRTLTQHINALRMEQAARLLRETDLPVMEIGFRVGLENFSYFIKRFRTVYGCSPTAYRKAQE